VWGTGTPLRQFCYTPDFCLLTLWVLFSKIESKTIALVPEKEHSIKDVADIILNEFSIQEAEYDTSKADG